MAKKHMPEIISVTYEGCECPLCMLQWVIGLTDHKFDAATVAGTFGLMLGAIIAEAPSPQAAEKAMDAFTEEFNAAHVPVPGAPKGEAPTITSRSANRRPI